MTVQYAQLLGTTQGKPVDDLLKAVDIHPGCQHQTAGGRLSTIRQTGSELANNTSLTGYPQLFV